MSWVAVGCTLIPVTDIRKVEYSRLASETVTVTLIDGTVTDVTGFQALELIWLLKPSALEGNNNIKWKKHMWAIHNLIAHPLMQLLAWCRLYKQAIQIHDDTVPKPIGYKNDTTKRYYTKKT